MLLYIVIVYHVNVCYTANRQLQLKPSVAFAWPYLFHMQRMYTFLPVGVLAIHSSSVVDCYLQLLNVWHLPLQVRWCTEVFDIISHAS